mgnify:CR=1 FL=1
MESLEALMEPLNPAQKAAVNHGMEPLLIVAGAGTGKTATLVHRVAKLIADGIDPSRILLLTFTRRAAAEMLHRAGALIARLGRGSDAAGRVWGGTFHATANRLLRQFGRRIQLSSDFTILDQGDAEDLMNLVRSEAVGKQKHSRFPRKGTCLAIYSRCVNARMSLGDVLAKDYPWCAEWEAQLAALFDLYVQRKQQSHTLDYDDLLLYWNAALSDRATGDRMRELFDCIMVDEYQDTNLLQAEIIYQLSPEGRGLAVVGDDAQSIYRFRAATVENIFEFPNRYPNARIVTIEQNYRSTQAILSAANAVIAQAARRYRKDLWSERTGGVRPRFVACDDEYGQTNYVVETILERREAGVELRRQAVLFRASHHSLLLEAELARRNIPFRKYGGLRFVEMAHIKDLLAFLRLAENPRDLAAGTRMLMLLPGIGIAQARKLLAMLEPGGGFSEWRKHRPAAATRSWWPGLVDLMCRLSMGKDPLPIQVHAVREYYAPLVDLLYDNPIPRKKDLEQMEVVASRYGNRQRLLVDLALDPPTAAQEPASRPHLDDEYLVLSTIHSAKGLEWDTVLIIHAADGNIPADMATRSQEDVEEERRLFYVALTRAQNQLHVCCPLRYHFRSNADQHSYGQRTRFLPDNVLKLFDVVTFGTNRGGEQRTDEHHRGVASENVREGLRRLWNASRSGRSIGR